MIGAAQLIMIEEIDGLKFWKVTLGDRPVLKTVT
jgi:hypothetical protein